MRKAINVLSNITVIVSIFVFCVGIWYLISCRLFNQPADFHSILVFIKDYITSDTAINPKDPNTQYIIKSIYLYSGLICLFSSLFMVSMALIDNYIINKKDSPKSLVVYIILAVLTSILSARPLAVLILIYGIIEHNKDKTITEQTN